MKPIPSPGSALAVWGSAAAPSAPADEMRAPADATSGDQTEEEYIEAFVEESSNGDAYEQPYIEIDPEALAEIEGDEAAAAEGGAGPTPAVAGAGWSHIGGLELGGGVLHSAASVADSIILLTDKGCSRCPSPTARPPSSPPCRRRGMDPSCWRSGGCCGSPAAAPTKTIPTTACSDSSWTSAHGCRARRSRCARPCGARGCAPARPRVRWSQRRNAPARARYPHVYDPSADRWREALELPTPRAGAAAATLGGRVHVVGGHDTHHRGEAHEAHVAHESFDLEKGSWRAEPPLPEARPVLASTAHNGRQVVVVGGERARHGGHAPADVHEYDPAARTWKRRPGVPPRLREPIVVSHSGRLLAFGTRADGGVEIHELI